MVTAMAEGLILYRSKYGATKKYADWLHEMTGFEIQETHKALPQQAERYGVIVLCGGIYASGIAGLPFLRKNLDRLRDKKLAILCVGASPYEENALYALRKHNLKDGLEEIPLFYARGMWNEKQMTWKDRNLCKLLRKSVEKKDPRTYEPWMKALLCAAGQVCDWTDRAYLAPLLEYLEIDP